SSAQPLRALPKSPRRAALDAQEAMHDGEELGELVVMDPVARVANRHQLRRAKGIQAAVALPITRPRSVAAYQQRGAADTAPDFGRVLEVEQIGRMGACVVVELPRVGAVLVAPHTVDGQMARLL